MNINNEDIAKQHVRDLRQELERCRMATKLRSKRNEAAHAAAAVRTVEGKWKSLLETIIMMGRRML
ncbi:hypothetical protein [Paenibacillus lautus]|jgi:hypothetical protein|uniref:Uncharacterized protein n=1 Tax=Paenibacillus lautus TaxID=1401 RepID=A0A385TSL4_PAELA|nr:hypothetical protein [Paenibacillus lautus]AYB46098.1 hypothetical protein D5F53_23630 [Paenibacillus lautus]MBY0162702.1 hypothetical protein [Cytobacillus firmus]MCI1777460.1 hypothetical protein [Paenibacillus lautus]VTR62620.1 Uncharacterised protein [Actinobacillus pleuropneumoniae]